MEDNQLCGQHVLWTAAQSTLDKLSTITSVCEAGPQTVELILTHPLVSKSKQVNPY